MTHSADVLRLRNIEVETLRDKLAEVEAKLELAEQKLEDYAKNK